MIIYINNEPHTFKRVTIEWDRNKIAADYESGQSWELCLDDLRVPGWIECAIWENGIMNTIDGITYKLNILS